jgi:hypothetical protein
METAPRDGTTVIGLSNDRRVWLVVWDKNDEIWADPLTYDVPLGKDVDFIAWAELFTGEKP